MNGRNGAAAMLVLRLVTGWVFLWHGLGKFFGPPFAGIGLTPFSAVLSLHLPHMGDSSIIALATLIAAVEAAGGVLLVLGWGTGGAASVLLIMRVANVALIRFSYGLFGPFGWEDELMLMAILMAIILGGAGAFALDTTKPRTDAPASRADPARY